MSNQPAQNTIVKKAMRDVFLTEVLRLMDEGKNIFFLSADFGSPVLDHIRSRHPDRFVNVGIAEQNMINVATGLALEGYTVYAYAIAPFITMRCFEQIRVNLAILSQIRPMNVNLIGVGAGFSYEVSGPTHHCLEDLSVMRTLPNLKVISTSDFTTAASLAQYTFENSGPKYIRFDAKPLPKIHEQVSAQDFDRGFIELKKGQKTCLISTGVLTHKALEVVNQLEEKGTPVGHIDMMCVKGFNAQQLIATLSKYQKVITLEEGFLGAGGLDAAIGNLILQNQLPIKLKTMGLKDRYIFHIGPREYLHSQNDLDSESILKSAQEL